MICLSYMCPLQVRSEMTKVDVGGGSYCYTGAGCRLHGGAWLSALEISHAQNSEVLSNAKETLRKHETKRNNKRVQVAQKAFNKTEAQVVDFELRESAIVKQAQERLFRAKRSYSRARDDQKREATQALLDAQLNYSHYKARSQRLAESVTEATNDSWRTYYESTDAKHFYGEAPGSKFTNPQLNGIQDVIKFAYEQRGSLAGDDREELIKRGSDPHGFTSSARYLLVHTAGTVGVQNTDAMKDTDKLTITRTKIGAPCNLVSEVDDMPFTNFGSLIMMQDSDTGKPRLITTFPGPVTKNPNPLDPESFEAMEGQTVTVADAKKLFGVSKLWVNTQMKARPIDLHAVKAYQEEIAQMGEKDTEKARLSLVRRMRERPGDETLKAKMQTHLH